MIISVRTCVPCERLSSTDTWIIITGLYDMRIVHFEQILSNHSPKWLSQLLPLC